MKPCEYCHMTGHVPDACPIQAIDWEMTRAIRRDIDRILGVEPKLRERDPNKIIPGEVISRTDVRQRKEL